MSYLKSFYSTLLKLFKVGVKSLLSYLKNFYSTLLELSKKQLKSLLSYFCNFCSKLLILIFNFIKILQNNKGLGLIANGFLAIWFHRELGPFILEVNRFYQLEFWIKVDKTFFPLYINLWDIFIIFITIGCLVLFRRKIKEFYKEIGTILINIEKEKYIGKKIISSIILTLLISGFLYSFLQDIQTITLIYCLIAIIFILIVAYIFNRDKFHTNIKEFKLKLKNNKLELFVHLSLRWLIVIILRVSLIMIFLNLNNYFPDNGGRFFLFLAEDVLNNSIFKIIFSALIGECLFFNISFGCLGTPRLLKSLASAALNNWNKALAMAPLTNWSSPGTSAHRNSPSPRPTPIGYHSDLLDRLQEEAKRKTITGMLRRMPYPTQLTQVYGQAFRDALWNENYFAIMNNSCTLQRALQLDSENLKNRNWVIFTKENNFLFTIDVRGMPWTNPVCPSMLVSVFETLGNFRFENLPWAELRASGEYMYSELTYTPGMYCAQKKVGDIRVVPRGVNSILFVWSGTHVPYDETNPGHSNRMFKILDKNGRYHSLDVRAPREPQKLLNSYLLRNITHVKVIGNSPILDEVYKNPETNPVEFDHSVKQVSPLWLRGQ